MGPRDKNTGVEREIKRILNLHLFLFYNAYKLGRERERERGRERERERERERGRQTDR